MTRRFSAGPNSRPTRARTARSRAVRGGRSPGCSGTMSGRRCFSDWRVSPLAWRPPDSIRQRSVRRRTGSVFRQAASGPKIHHKGLKRLNLRPGFATSLVADRVYNASPRDECPENPAQSLEKVESAPGIATSPVAALAERGDAVSDRVYKAAASGHGPENPAQSLEKIESAPGFVTSPVAALAERGDAVSDRVYKAAAVSTSARKIPRKALKRLNLRPGSRRAL